MKLRAFAQNEQPQGVHERLKDVRLKNTASKTRIAHSTSFLLGMRVNTKNTRYT